MGGNQSQWNGQWVPRRRFPGASQQITAVVTLCACAPHQATSQRSVSSSTTYLSRELLLGFSLAPKSQTGLRLVPTARLLAHSQKDHSGLKCLFPLVVDCMVEGYAGCDQAQFP